MEAASHRKMGEIAGQASYAETARPAGTHHPGFNPARSMDPRPVLGKRNYRHRCLADRQTLSGHRKGKEYLDLSIRRRGELENGSIVKSYRKKIRDIVIADGEPEEADIFGMMDENRIQDLPF